MSRGEHWTDDELAEARKLRTEGRTFRDIAKQLPGRTKDSVRHILGYSYKVDEPARDDLLPALARAMTRFANDNGIDMTEALNRLLYAGEAR